MQPSESLGHYRIAEKIGEGGMGEVYRATDTKLRRDVAIKVLPEAVARDPDRMARFSREAQVLASLNHPNIASIYGLEDSDGKRALVMELVEGETLAERMRRGPIPLEEAIAIAKQMAEALEAAHEQGIIHRDLKPANAKITPDGDVKLLDFGLAKALEGEPTAPATHDLSHSPTLSAAATRAGVILGTAAYMSPEQARGQKTDRRSDIWSFGVVLLEMLTGRSVFQGETVTDVLANLLAREPNWESLPEGTPPSVRRLLRRCLQKDIRKRVQAIGDARLLLEEYLEDPDTSDVLALPVVPKPPVWRRALPWAIAGLSVLGLISALAVLWLSASETGRIVRLRAEIADERLFSDLGASVVLSPDGARMAYVVGDGNQRQLYVRSMDQLEGVPLSGTGQSYHPFFSPDGQWLGFVTSSELKKVSITGGAPLALTGVNLSRGASWGEGDVIVYAPTPAGGLMRVSAAGGAAEPVTKLRDGEASHRWPQFLPGGEAVLFTSHTSSSNFDEANIEVVVLESGERKLLHRGGSYPRYVESGHLVFVREGTLFAAPLDLDRLELSSAPVPVLQKIASSSYHGSAQYDVSSKGLLAYIRGGSQVYQYAMVLVDREGQAMPLSDDEETFGEPHFAPDGKRLAVQRYGSGGASSDIWVYDLERGVSTRLTFDESKASSPFFSPDGERVYFSSDASGSLNVYWKRADGSGEAVRLTESPKTQFASSVSPDGKYVVFHESNATTGSDLFIVDTSGEGEPEDFLTTPFSESEAAFSPDGRWIAYQSNESGAMEIYVRPFPAGAGKWQISTDGGTYPRWAPDGRELFYRKDDALMVVQVRSSGGSFIANRPTKLFDGPFLTLSIYGSTLADYDVAPDGEHFVMMQGENQVEKTQVTFVFNWFEDLARSFSASDR